MNLFFKSYRYYLVFFLLVAYESGFNRGIAQDNRLYLTPWIEEIILPSQNPEIPNETFYRDPSGTLFIGKNNGLTMVSGHEMSHLPMSGPVYVTGDGSDTLYYAAMNDLGFLVKQPSHAYKKVSRIHLLSASERTFLPTGFIEEEGGRMITSDHGTYLLSRTQTEFLKDRKIPRPAQLTDSLFNGITPAEIRQVFRSSGSETWILGAYSLHKMIHPPPLSIMETNGRVPGRILVSQIGRVHFLLGTTQGLYSLEQDPVHARSWRVADLHIEGRAPVRLLHSAYNQTIAAGSEGLYLITGRHSITLDKGSFTGIRILREGSVIASGDQGLFRYDLQDSVWKAMVIDRSMTNAHSFVDFNGQLFFLCKNGVFTIGTRGRNPFAIHFETGEILRRIIVLDQELFLIGSQKVYRYDEAEETFQPLPHGRRSRWMSESESILQVSPEEYWILKDHGADGSRIVQILSLDDEGHQQACFPILQNLGEIVAFHVRDSMLYVTGQDKISLLDLRSLKIARATDHIQVDMSQVTDHSIRFTFIGLELQTSPLPLFRQRILGGSEEWSDWQSSRNYLLAGLKHGSYTMEVEAMDLYGRITEPSVLVFTLPTPWYARWYFIGMYVLLFLVGLFLFRKWRLLGYQRAESRIAARMESKIQSLAAEKEESDKLVAEMLPEETAKRLKYKGKSKWDKYERATVLFSDIQGFTKIAEEMNPEALIDELDQFFFHFDSVVEKYNIEKIKTIGDAYMAAGGIPHKNSTNPVEVVLAALEMQSYMQQLKSSRADIWDLRIGIHTGPVIAGVVGHKKVSYDIWGDTVNTASRMESSGLPGKINISSSTYGMVKDFFLCEYRGKLPVKYKGNIDMYFVIGLRPELAVDLKEIPNKRFFVKLQLLRLADLEDKIFNDLLNDLPESLHFHTREHARKVYDQSFLLCRSEEIEQEDRLLTRTAALMLFTGLTQTYYNFENRSTVLCREILPEYAYSEKQVDQINNLILSTKMPFNPNNSLEAILIDARMEYIGRPDYTVHIKKLYQELREAGAKINGQQFKKQQLELLYEFEYNTLAAKRLREVPGPDQMTTLEEERWI
jgi:adenylate cyclase